MAAPRGPLGVRLLVPPRTSPLDLIILAGRPAVALSYVLRVGRLRVDGGGAAPVRA